MALDSARQLRHLDCHPTQSNDDWPDLRAQQTEYFDEWQTEMQAALPGTTVTPIRWSPTPPELEGRWPTTKAHRRQAVSATVGPGPTPRPRGERAK